MQDNEGNGTCYTKSGHDSLKEKYKDPEKFLILTKNGGSAAKNKMANIQNCDDILRSVKDHFPTENEIPKGYKAMHGKDGQEMEDDWQRKGGLAKCKDNEDCKPKKYKATDQMKKRMKMWQNRNGNGIRLVGKHYLILFGIFALKELNRLRMKH